MPVDVATRVKRGRIFIEVPNWGGRDKMLWFDAAGKKKETTINRMSTPIKM